MIHGQDGDPKRDLSRLGTHAHASDLGRWLIVRNKANSRRCPVGWGLAGRGLWVSYKQSQFPDGQKGTRGVRLLVPPIRAIMQNKANSAQAAERASAWRETSYGESNMQQTSAKQSQFAADRPEETLGQDRKYGRQGGQACKTKPISSRRTGTASRRTGPKTLPPVGASCAKQSQFAPPRCAPVAVAREHERRGQMVYDHQADSGLRRIWSVRRRPSASSEMETPSESRQQWSVSIRRHKALSRER
jgi:hypothetical protein